MDGGCPGTFGKLQSLDLVESAGKRAKEGDSPVSEKSRPFWSIFLSTAGHEKSCGKLRGPPRKAKYSPVTDSEEVP
jgi:hypothetical protein